MVDSLKDRLENLQKTLDDFIKHASERFKQVEDKISQQGPSGSGENSSTKNRDKGSGGFNNNQGTKVTNSIFQSTMDRRIPRAGYAELNSISILSKSRKGRNCRWPRITWRGNPKCGTNYSKTVKKSLLGTR
jgi:hypothetical protein